MSDSRVRVHWDFLLLKMLWGSLIRPQKLSPHQPKKGHSPLLVAIHDAFRTSHFKEFLHSILPQSDETTQEGPLSYFIGPRKRAILDREEERPDFIDLLITRCERIQEFEMCSVSFVSRCTNDFQGSFIIGSERISECRMLEQADLIDPWTVRYAIWIFFVDASENENGPSLSCSVESREVKTLLSSMLDHLCQSTILDCAQISRELSWWSCEMGNVPVEKATPWCQCLLPDETTNFENEEVDVNDREGSTRREKLCCCLDLIFSQRRWRWNRHESQDSQRLAFNPNVCPPWWRRALKILNFLFSVKWGRLNSLFISPLFRSENPFFKRNRNVYWFANKRFEISKFKFKFPRARTYEIVGLVLGCVEAKFCK